MWMTGPKCWLAARRLCLAAVVSAPAADVTILQDGRWEHPIVRPAANGLHE